MLEKIEITNLISIDASEIELNFVRSSGPGGQNVNKVSTAVQLRFNVKNSSSLPDRVKIKAAMLAGSRFTNNGEIILTASSHRSQLLNRQDANERLIALLKEACSVKKNRVKTRPTLASKRRRLDAKTNRGKIKKMRKIDRNHD